MPNLSWKLARSSHLQSYPVGDVQVGLDQPVSRNLAGVHDLLPGLRVEWVQRALDSVVRRGGGG